MPLGTYRAVLRHLHANFPQWHLHSSLALPRHIDSQPLERQAIFFEYVILRGHRYYASKMAGSRNSALIEVSVPVTHPSAIDVSCGELVEIIQFQQNASTPILWFGRMRWFRPCDRSTTSTSLHQNL